ncbi:uncharacterized protein LOC141652431 [Silene latifolia]|uniref:uncharacterized protein LOC141652431 n=1 Tax=Silene latifolia TaxID=37657 RepID=UPI003D774246
MYSTRTTPIVGRGSSTSSSTSISTTAAVSLFNHPHFIINSNSSTLSLISRRNHNPFTNNKLLLIRPKPRPRPPLTFSPLMQMQDCTVKMEVDVPVSVAYNCYSDRESIPQWMPFISSVKVLEDKPDLSRWTLKYEAFGRDIQFSWLARNLQPIPNKKIHWRSLEGLPNSGAVRFFPKGSSSCLIELTVSYEVPQILVPVSSALQPFLQSLLLRGLERFSNFAKSRRLDTTS